jgi:putative protease
MEEEIGKVTHYYDKIGVMVIKLTDKVSVGDRIKIKRGDEEFEETIESMQVEHENIDKAKKGDEIAIKISGKTKEGAMVYKVE